MILNSIVSLALFAVSAALVMHYGLPLPAGEPTHAFIAFWVGGFAMAAWAELKFEELFK